MMQPTKKIRHFQTHRKRLLLQVPEVSVRHIGSPPSWMLILQLHQYHRPSPVYLLPEHDRQQLVEKSVHTPLERLIILPHPNTFLESQPQWITPIVPLGTVIRSYPHDGIKPHAPDQSKKGPQIMITAEVEFSFLRFMPVPKCIDLDTIKARPLQPQQPVPPQLMRYTGIFQSRRYKKSSFAIY